MAIQELQVENFRSLKDVKWQPGRLNLLVGRNGSGKSNLLRCLDLIHRCTKAKLAEAMTEIGGMVPLLWDHSATSLGWRLRIDPVDPQRDPTTDALTLDFSIRQVAGSGYEIVRDSLGNWIRFLRNEVPSPYWIYKRDRSSAVLYDQQHHSLVRFEEESTENPEGYDPYECLISQVADSRNRIPVLTTRWIESWSIFHDVTFRQGSLARKPAGLQFAKRLNPDGTNFVPVLHTLYTGSREFRDAIDEGMSAGFGSEYDSLVFQPASAQQIQLAIQWRSSRDPHSGVELSDGTLQFLFLIAVLSMPEPPPLLALDEPECGLHPSMLPIIAEYANSASDKTQVVLTSHSPSFIDAFSDLEPTVTVCHWESGHSTLHVLHPEALSVWLNRYRLGELFSRGDLDAMVLPPVDDAPSEGKPPVLTFDPSGN
jgi:predicted ATPase